jgi:hypothetical protein
MRGETNMDLSKYVVGKIFSGRWLFTATSAFVFAYLAMNGILPIDRVMEILLIVIYAYFTRTRIEPPSLHVGDNDEAPEEK